MFTTKEAVQEITGIEVTPDVLSLAHIMVEAWVGRMEGDVTEGRDVALLGRATAFQAVYIRDSLDVILEQAAVKSITLSESTTAFDLDMFAPYMSPWAILSCKGLSWMSTRSVHTGPVFDQTRYQREWERD